MKEPLHVRATKLAQLLIVRTVQADTAQVDEAIRRTLRDDPELAASVAPH